MDVFWLDGVTIPLSFASGKRQLPLHKGALYSVEAIKKSRWKAGFFVFIIWQDFFKESPFLFSKGRLRGYMDSGTETLSMVRTFLITTLVAAARAILAYILSSSSQRQRHAL